MQASVDNTISMANFVAQPEQVCEEVRANGPKVITEEGRPSCVILPQAAYEEIMDRLTELEIELMAEERLLKHRKKEDYISQEEIDKEFGFTEEDLKDWDEVEIG